MTPNNEQYILLSEAEALTLELTGTLDRVELTHGRITSRHTFAPAPDTWREEFWAGGRRYQVVACAGGGLYALLETTPNSDDLMFEIRKKQKSVLQEEPEPPLAEREQQERDYAPSDENESDE